MECKKLIKKIIKQKVFEIFWDTLTYNVRIHILKKTIF